MSKKQFEDIEDKIRQAAENNQPPYQEAAWEKMNALLDKDGDKRRVPVWWIPLLLLLLAGSGYLYFNNSSKQNSEQLTAKEENKKDNSATAGTKQQDESNKKEITGNEKSSAETPVSKSAGKENNNSGKEIAVTEQNNQQYHTDISQKTNRSYKKTAPALHRFNKKGKAVTQSSGAVVETENENKKEIKTENPASKEDKAVSATETAKTIQEEVSNSIDKKENIKTVNDTAASNVKKEENKNIAAEKKKDKKTNSTYKASKFYFLAAIGAEAASTKFLSFSNSKFSPAYGVGIGYSITKKLSIQSGFFAGAKKYIAGGKDYHPKPGSYWNDVYIKKVDANCMVYEIPLILRYSLIQKPKIEYFITAGASNYIMKKEDYMYNYMRNYIPYTGRYVYTGNKHFLSVLTFSAGIDKRLSQKFSLLASPTFGIPVSGVGDGRIKLYSAGITAGLKYQPAAKK